MGIRKITTTVSDDVYEELRNLKKQGYKISDLLKFAIEVFKAKQNAEHLYKKAIDDVRVIADTIKELSLFSSDYKLHLERLKDLVINISTFEREIKNVVSSLNELKTSIESSAVQIQRELNILQKERKKLKELHNIWYREFYEAILKRNDLPMSLKDDIAKLYKKVVEKAKEEIPELFE